jgi:hypothetical protein
MVESSDTRCLANEQVTLLVRLNQAYTAAFTLRALWDPDAITDLDIDGTTGPMSIDKKEVSGYFFAQ